MPLNESGYELLPEFLDPTSAERIINEAESALRDSKGGGIRNAEKKFNSVNTLARSDLVINQASTYVPGKPHLVRAILFDKSPSNNWLVTWHQDKTISVSSRFTSEGWGPWSVKDGIIHVQPPVDLLNDMVTFRIHLDASTQENGCLKVIPKSHLQGIMSQADIHRYTESRPYHTIEAPALSALVMRPHLLHASSKATAPTRRRILHLEYSSYKLPPGVTWV